MTRKAIKTTFAWLLMTSGCLGVLGLIAHILCQDFGLFGAPDISGGYISLGGRVIDCTTWWGKLLNLFISLCLFAWGWGIIHDMKKQKSEPAVGGYRGPASGPAQPQP
jgi:hypothetical protein